jgi:hypothetical protein
MMYAADPLMSDDPQQRDRQALIAQMGGQAQPAPPPISPLSGALTERYDPASGVPNGGVTGGATAAPAAQPASAGGGDYQSQFRDIMSQYGYGAAALGNAEEALKAAGFQMQRDSAGQARGRIRLPDGRLVDIHDTAEGITEQDNWFNNPRGSDWGWQDRGQHPLGDAGWSFDGVGYGGGGARPAPTASGPSSFQGIQGLMPTDMDFHNTLQQRLQEILGAPASGDREALLALLK